jgi:hypothetical protein
MDPDEKKEETGKKRSRISGAILSLIVPGLGQIVRGRIVAGLLFFSNVIVYGLPLVITHNIEFDVQTPSLLIALGVWVCSALDAFLYKSSFLVMALLVSLFFFGAGFFSAFFILPLIDV